MTAIPWCYAFGMAKAKTIRVQVKVSIPRAGEFLVSVPIDLSGGDGKGSWNNVDTSDLAMWALDDIEEWVRERLRIELVDKKKVAAAMKKALGR